MINKKRSWHHEQGCDNKNPDHDYCADGIYMALAYNQPYDHRDTDSYDLAFVGIDFPVDSNRGSGGNHCVCC